MLQFVDSRGLCIHIRSVLSGGISHAGSGANANSGAPRGVFNLTSVSQTSRPSLVFIPASSAPLIATLTTIPHIGDEGEVQGDRNSLASRDTYKQRASTFPCPVCTYSTRVGATAKPPIVCRHANEESASEL